MTNEGKKSFLQVDNLLDRALETYKDGDLSDAASLLQTILEHDARHAEALHLLGVIAHQLGENEIALSFLERAVTERASFAEAESNLGTVLLTLGRSVDAVRTLRVAHTSAPYNPVILFNLGNALMAVNNMLEAEKAYEKAVKLKQDYAQAWCQLGLVRRDLGKMDGAVTAYEKAVAANSEFSEALYNLANVHRDLDQFGKAEANLRRALDVRPDYAMAWNSLGTLLGDMGRAEEATDALENAARFAPDSMAYASNRLCALQYINGITNDQLAAAHTEWYWRHVALTIKPREPFKMMLEPDSPLKLGFVSPDFGLHPVGFLSASLFENLDPQRCQITVFSTRPRELDDMLSKKIKEACVAWRSVNALDDDSLADLIASEEIDILFDMSGHTSGHRLGVFARRPAPLQMSWIGYVGTTGLPNMDYLISDHHQSPEGSDQTYCETALQLPDGYACYRPPEDTPDVAPLPALKNGYVSFGCLNNPGKLNAEVLATFATILTHVSGSRLLLRFRGLDDPAVQAPIAAAMGDLGVDPDRLIFEGRAHHFDFLDTYNRIDIALDTFPYSGGLTTCEALWMGVPTVTFPGQTFAGRHAPSHLHAAGFGHLVAQNRSSMITTAVDLSNDLESLSDLRASMRERVAVSALCDGKRFAKNFDQAMRLAWHDCCNQQSV